jgi:hypothetical protein
MLGSDLAQLSPSRQMGIRLRFTVVQVPRDLSDLVVYRVVRSLPFILDA